jgi:uncharacterized protein (TIGR00730 family)
VAAVCVFCASGIGIDGRYLDLASAFGSALAVAGHTLVSGGGRVSMMGAVATAARAGGAHTIGVIPSAMIPLEVADTEADELVVVDTMRERKRVMDERSDAFVALPGGLGTLEELLEVWTTRSLAMHVKPVVVLDPDGLYAPLWAYLQSLAARGFVRPAAFDALQRVTTVEAALECLDPSG